MDELRASEWYWLSVIQKTSFQEELLLLSKGHSLPKESHLLPLHPFIDAQGLLRVGGRGKQSNLPLSTRHPVLLPSSHPVVSLIVRTEHHRLLHAGPTLLGASLGCVYHIVGSRRLVRSITRSCTVCRRASARPKPQMLGQLPADRLSPGLVFQRVGVDYAGLSW